MDLIVDDAGFVRAPAPLAYRRLGDVASWPRWWRGTRVRRVPASGTGGLAETWAIELSGAPLRRLRLLAGLHGRRPDVGFLLALDGDVHGRAEFWLEPAAGGTVVHHVLSGRTPLPRPGRVLEDYRRAVRRGLWGLKDLLHLEARTSAGLPP